MIYKPQQGFQMRFLTNPAEVIIAGGSAGCSKTFSILLDTLRYANIKDFDPMLFRREMTDVRMPGGLWDEALNLYSNIFGNDITTNKTDHVIKVKNGIAVRFGSIQHEKDLINFQGLQTAGMYLDELTTFSASMFWFLFSRNRNRADNGIKPFIKATCNPDPESFVADLIGWYIGEDGFPIPSRGGTVRYMLRMDGEVFFYDSYQDCYFKNKIFLNEQSKLYGVNAKDLVKTFSFIPGKISENRELLKRNPTYLSNLLALDEDQKARYLDGNWKIKIDQKCLSKHDKLQELFSNYTDTTNAKKYITSDPSRHGRDLTVILVWQGWTVIECHVWKQTDSVDVFNEIEKLREKHLISISNVCVDADGVGYDTVKLGKYVAFRGGARPMADPKTGLRENYTNLKTQCAYRFADRVNNNDVAIKLVNDTCSLDGRTGIIKLKLNGKVSDFRDLIIEDLRSFKRADSHSLTRAMIDKEKQKEIIRRSPDFGDALHNRIYLDLIPVSW